jgi:O-antigen/teichoic acid export membrane protein
VTTTTQRSAQIPSGLRGLLRGSAGIAVAMAVMNVATYTFQMVCARVLGPSEYGAVAGLSALLMVIAVLQLGLQATAARRISATPGHVAQIENVILRVTYRAALVLGAVMLLASPVVMMVLRLDSLLPAVLLAIAAVPLTIQGGQAGILQGERRWLPLALLYLAMGVPRVLIGTLCILWMPTETGAMLGITLGLLVPAAVGWWVLRRGRVPGETSDDHRARAVIRETILGSLALLAFFVLSNTDIVIARNVLDSHQAGLYAGGLILTKAVLFLPQFVVVVAFPSMSTVEQRRTTLLRSLALVSLLGALCTVGAVVLSGVAMVFIGGQQYVDVESRLWMFAILGTMLSMLQLLVYSVLARQGTRSALLVGAAVAAVLVASLWVTTLGQLVTAVTIIDALLFATLLALSLWRMRALDAAPPPTPAHVQV